MKKLLAVLASLGVAASAGATVVACGNKSKDSNTDTVFTKAGFTETVSIAKADPEVADVIQAFKDQGVTVEMTDGSTDDWKQNAPTTADQTAFVITKTDAKNFVVSYYTTVSNDDGTFTWCANPKQKLKVTIVKDVTKLITNTDLGSLGTASADEDHTAVEAKVIAKIIELNPAVAEFKDEIGVTLNNQNTPSKSTTAKITINGFDGVTTVTFKFDVEQIDLGTFTLSSVDAGTFQLDASKDAIKQKVIGLVNDQLTAQTGFQLDQVTVDVADFNIEPATTSLDVTVNPITDSIYKGQLSTTAAIVIEKGAFTPSSTDLGKVTAKDDAGAQTKVKDLIDGIFKDSGLTTKFDTSAIKLDAGTFSVDVTWTESDKYAAGSATFTGTLEQAVLDTTITPSKTDVSLDMTTNPDESEDITLTLGADITDTSKVTVKSADESISTATLSSDAKTLTIRAVDKGTTTIDVLFDGTSKTTINVTIAKLDQTVALASDKADIDMKDGTNSATVGVTAGADVDAAKLTIESSSADVATATISKTEVKVTALKTGTTTLTAKYDGAEIGTITVTITDTSTVTISGGTSSIEAGNDTDEFTVAVDGKATIASIESSDKAIATVTTTANGFKVSGVSAGTATITVTLSNGQTATVDVEIKAATNPTIGGASSIKVDATEAYTLTGTTATVTNVELSDGTVASTDWTSGTSINVTGIKAGTTTLTVTLDDGKTATKDITIDKKDFDLTDVAISGALDTKPADSDAVIALPEVAAVLKEHGTATAENITDTGATVNVAETDTMVAGSFNVTWTVKAGFDISDITIGNKLDQAPTTEAEVLALSDVAAAITNHGTATVSDITDTTAKVSIAATDAMVAGSFNVNWTVKDQFPTTAEVSITTKFDSAPSADQILAATEVTDWFSTNGYTAPSADKVTVDTDSATITIATTDDKVGGTLTVKFGVKEAFPGTTSVDIKNAFDKKPDGQQILDSAEVKQWFTDNGYTAPAATEVTVNDKDATITIAATDDKVGGTLTATYTVKEGFPTTTEVSIGTKFDTTPTADQILAATEVTAWFSTNGYTVPAADKVTIGTDSATITVDPTDTQLGGTLTAKFQTKGSFPTTTSVKITTKFDAKPTAKQILDSAEVKKWLSDNGYVAPAEANVTVNDKDASIKVEATNDKVGGTLTATFETKSAFPTNATVTITTKFDTTPTADAILKATVVTDWLTANGYVAPATSGVSIAGTVATITIAATADKLGGDLKVNFTLKASLPAVAEVKVSLALLNLSKLGETITASVTAAPELKGLTTGTDYDIVLPDLTGIIGVVTNQRVEVTLNAKGANYTGSIKVSVSISITLTQILEADLEAELEGKLTGAPYADANTALAAVNAEGNNLTNATETAELTGSNDSIGEAQIEVTFIANEGYELDKTDPVTITVKYTPVDNKDINNKVTPDLFDNFEVDLNFIDGQNMTQTEFDAQLKSWVNEKLISAGLPFVETTITSNNEKLAQDCEHAASAGLTIEGTIDFTVTDSDYTGTATLSGITIKVNLTN